MVAAFLMAMVATAPSGEGAREAMQGFWKLVERRPGAACRRYLTPAARRQ